MEGAKTSLTPRPPLPPPQPLIPRAVCTVLTYCAARSLQVDTIWNHPRRMLNKQCLALYQGVRPRLEGPVQTLTHAQLQGSHGMTQNRYRHTAAEHMLPCLQKNTSAEVRPHFDIDLSLPQVR